VYYFFINILYFFLKRLRRLDRGADLLLRLGQKFLPRLYRSVQLRQALFVRRVPLLARLVPVARPPLRVWINRDILLDAEPDLPQLVER